MSGPRVGRAGTGPAPGAAGIRDDLRALLAHTGGRPVSLGALVEAAHVRGAAVLAVLLTTPFVVPVPLPFLSTPFGLTIAALGLCLAAGRRPWLPRWIRVRRIQHETLAKIVHAADRAATVVERVLRPRWDFMFWPGFRAASGVGITVAALILCLPLPIPFTNTIPAVAILLLATGFLERDGVVTLAGHLVGAAAWAYLWAWWEVVSRVLGRLLPTLG